MGFLATATAGPGAVLELLSGDGQTGAVNQALTDPVVVRVVDEYGNPVAGTAVAFSAAPGNGAALNAISLSGPSGQVSTDWVLGGAAGRMLLDAKAPNLIQVTFTATATASSPTSGASAPDR